MRIDYSVEKVNLKLDYNSFIELSETSNLTKTSWFEVFYIFYWYLCSIYERRRVMKQWADKYRD
jgi:hypothetical protein